MTTTCVIDIGCSEHIGKVIDGIVEYSNNQVIYLSHGGADVLEVPSTWTVITSKNLLPVWRARNICMENCRTQYLIWLDDDGIATKPYEQTFIDAFQGKRIGIVGYDAVIIQMDFEDQWYVNPFIETNFDYFDMPCAYNMDMIEEIGPHDSKLGRLVGDNTDLCIRARKNNWELKPIVCPGIEHHRKKFMKRKLRTVVNRTLETQKSHYRLRELHGDGWKPEIQRFIIDERLQFPNITGRLGGAESI